MYRSNRNVLRHLIGYMSNWPLLTDIAARLHVHVYCIQRKRMVVRVSIGRLPMVNKVIMAWKS
jgi:hypothetical protein